MIGPTEDVETCRRCGESIPPGEDTHEGLCHDCCLEEWGEEPEEDEKHDDYSFWKGCPIGPLWDPDWGPFGPRRRR